VNCCGVFPYDFFMIFSKIIFVHFFFNIELVKNYYYNKVKSYGENIVVFLTKYYGLLQYFSKWFFILFYWGKHCSFPHKTLSIATTFFLMGFFPSKIIFVGFFFNIKLVENLALFFFFINRKAKSCGESTVSFLPKHRGLLQIILFSL